MSEVLAPAIRYAKEGFPVSELIAYYWNRSVPILQEFDGFAVDPLLAPLRSLPGWRQLGPCLPPKAGRPSRV